MLSRGGRLGTLAVQALGEGRSLSCLESPADLADWAHPPVDGVLLDFPRRQRGIVYRQLRQRYRGPVLALLDSGDDGGGLPSDRGPLAILRRPFSGEELADVLGPLLAAADDAPATVGAFEPATPVRVGTELPVLSALSAPLSPAPAAQLLVSRVTLDRAEPRLHESRWDALVRRGLRPWQVAVGATAIVLLGLSFSAPSPCRSGCTNVAVAAGAAERNALAGIGALANSGVGSSPRAGVGGSAASGTGSTIIPGVPPPVTSLGGLISGLGGGGTSPPLLIAPLGGAAPIPPPSSPLPPPTTTTSPTATTKPTATTRPPTTTAPPPPTTEPPPPTTTTAPPPPTTEPPPPTTTTAPPPPTTEPPPPTTTTAPV